MTNETHRINLTAAILNNQREAEIYRWLALTAPDYGMTKQFNKRFETWLNARAAERFGTKTIENWGMNGESKTFPLVTFYLSKDAYQLSDTVKYELKYTYDGKAGGYDYDAKKPVLRDSTERETLYSQTGVSSIIDWAVRAADSRDESVAKAQSNLAEIDAIMADRAVLEQQIEAFNDRLSYAINDLRFKR